MSGNAHQDQRVAHKQPKGKRRKPPWPGHLAASPGLVRRYLVTVVGMLSAPL